MGILNSILKNAGFGEIPKELAGKTNTPPSAVPLENLTPAPAISLDAQDASLAAQLDHLADANEENLNWRGSVVDLLEVLGLHSDVETRRHLAAELYCPPHIMADTDRMDSWLHEAILRKIAQYGGNVPPELFH